MKYSNLVSSHHNIHIMLKCTSLLAVSVRQIWRKKHNDWHPVAHKVVILTEQERYCQCVPTGFSSTNFCVYRKICISYKYIQSGWERRHRANYHKQVSLNNTAHTQQKSSKAYIQSSFAMTVIISSLFQCVLITPCLRQVL